MKYRDLYTFVLLSAPTFLNHPATKEIVKLQKLPPKRDWEKRFRIKSHLKIKNYRTK